MGKSVLLHPVLLIVNATPSTVEQLGAIKMRSIEAAAAIAVVFALMVERSDGNDVSLTGAGAACLRQECRPITCALLSVCVDPETGEYLPYGRRMWRQSAFNFSTDVIRIAVVNVSS